MKLSLAFETVVLVSWLIPAVLKWGINAVRMVLVAGFSLLVVVQAGFLIFSIGDNDILTELSALIASWMNVPENRRLWMGMSFAIIIGLPSWLVSRRITSRFEY